MAAAYESVPEVGEAVAQASDALGEDLGKIIADGELLGQTANAQPALLAVCAGVFRASKISAPVMFAGHSLGEYTALVCAGSLDFSDAVRLVRRRGELMAGAHAGGMAAILGSDVQTVEECCAELRAGGGLAWAANYNAPAQTVISGRKEDVEQCCDMLKERGAKRAAPLKVSVASHCPLMEDAARKFLPDLEAASWRAPSVPVIHNATLEPAAPAEIPGALSMQLTGPVRWTETLALFAARGVGKVFECGPGGVLSGLAKRTPGAPPHIPLSGAAALADACA